MKRLLSLITLIPLLFTGCSTFDSNYSSGSTTVTDKGFANIKDGNLVTDNGLTFIITEDESDGKWTSEKRIYYSIEINAAVSTSVYSAILTEYIPTYLPELKYSTETEVSSLGDDPLYFYTGSISGTGQSAYINLFCQYICLIDSDISHTISVVKDEEASSLSKTVITLYHDGKGDFYTSGKQSSLYEIMTQTISIPAYKLAPNSNVTDFDIQINYNWFSDNDYTTREDMYYTNSVELE